MGFFTVVGEGLKLANNLFAEIFSPLRKMKRRDERKREELDALEKEIGNKDDEKTSDHIDDIRRSGS